jgi:hypothetical protein
MKSIILASAFLVSLLVFQTRSAHAECSCVAVAGYVDASIQASVATADSLYASGDFDGALDLYAKAYADSKDSVLLYAQAMCQWQLGEADDAKAMFQAYADAGGELKFKDRADAAVGAIDKGVKKAIGFGIGAGGAVEGGAEGAVGAGAGVVGGVTAKPKKVAKGAAILLGVVAVVAVGTIAITGIRAGISDKISFSSFDKGLALGGGLSALVMGGSAVYLWGLTAATGAAGTACGVGVARSF